MGDKNNQYDIVRYISKYLAYEDDSGIFTWLTSMKGRLSGRQAGAIDKDGYRIICFKGRMFKAHRLAWFMVYGYLPKETIDHINRVRDDNRISNLRLATMLEQGRNKKVPKNNTSGHVGVTWSSSSKKWLSQLCFNKKTHYVGLFSDIEMAVMERELLKERLQSGEK